MLLIIAALFLFGSSVLSGMESAIERLGRVYLRSESLKKKPLLYFVRGIFKERIWEGLILSLRLSQLLFQLGFATSILFALSTQPLLILLLALFCGGFLVEYLFTIFATIQPHFFFKIFLAPVSFFVLILSPLTVSFLAILKLFLPPISNVSIRDKILEILHESDLPLDQSDQKLILSVISFKEKVAREVMVPRINIFSLSSDTSVQEAAEYFIKEGYSRIPVYKENVDHIIGVLHYKDILKIITESKLETIEAFVKPVLYTPESKKISALLQEFRSKQIHLAIVVDEYGGTEGIVTIEDILEELVGEIADEYDIGEAQIYTRLPSGAFIVDARMNILDIEEDLGIKIPQSPEYDTIGGYIFHRAGSIPSKGWRLHHDDFDLEILSSNERSIEKIKITPHLQKNAP